MRPHRVGRRGGQSGEVGVVNYVFVGGWIVVCRKREAINDSTHHCINRINYNRTWFNGQGQSH